jgi:hypothetical protein
MSKNTIGLAPRAVWVRLTNERDEGILRAALATGAKAADFWMNIMMKNRSERRDVEFLDIFERERGER